MGDNIIDSLVGNVDAFDVLGILGVALYVASYAALQLGFVSGRGYLYPGLNGLAAVCVLGSLVPNFHVPSATIQIIWLVISVAGISSFYLLSKRARITDEERSFLSSKDIRLPSMLSRKLLDLGQWVNAPVGTVLISQGKPVEHLHFLATGGAIASFNGRDVAAFPAGSYVGEMTCLSGAPAIGTVVLSSPSRYLRIDAMKLRKLIEKYAEIGEALEASFLQESRLKAGQLTPTPK